MVHIVKNEKQRLPPLKINIRLGLQLAVFGALYLYGGFISTVLGVFLGYRLLRLIFRLIGLLMTSVFNLIFIIVLLIIISLIII